MTQFFVTSKYFHTAWIVLLAIFQHDTTTLSVSAAVIETPLPSRHLRSLDNNKQKVVPSSNNHATTTTTERDLQRDFVFRRYLLEIGGFVEDSLNDNCQAPIPTVRISCAASLQLMYKDDAVSCQSSDVSNNLICTGSGRVLVDCTSRSLFDFYTGLALTINMNKPSDNDVFSTCDNVGQIGQAFIVGIVCPDNTATYDTLACDPITTYFKPGETAACLTQCQGECTDLSTLSDISGTVLDPGSCLWESEDIEETPTTLMPTLMPITTSSSPTRQPSMPITNSPTTKEPDDICLQTPCNADRECAEGNEGKCGNKYKCDSRHKNPNFPEYVGACTLSKESYIKARCGKVKARDGRGGSRYGGC